MNEQLEWGYTLKHLTPFTYFHNGVAFSVGGNKYNALTDIATLISQIAGTTTDKEKMIDALPIAQEKIALSNLPEKEKAEWTSYLVTYVVRLKKSVDNPGLIAKMNQFIGTYKSLIQAGPEAMLWGVVKPLIPILVIVGVVLVSALIFIPKIKTPIGLSIEPGSKKRSKKSE